MEKSKQHRLSSNATLVLKVAFPTFWLGFFGLLTAFVLFSSGEDSPSLGNPIVKGVMLLAFIIVTLLFYFTIMRLKRVDADSRYLYVSNYFKTYRYKLDDIHKVKEMEFGIATVLKISLKEAGSFGQNLYVMINRPTFDKYLLDHPECAHYFYPET